MRKGFGQTPQVYASRSVFDLNHRKKTSFNLGELIPVDVQEVLPGDSFKVNTTAVARVTSSFQRPIMDNLYMDIFHFFVPDRLHYEKFESVFGNPNPSAYVDNSLESLPLNYGDDFVFENSLADYFEMPIGCKFERNQFNIMDFRNYALIYNYWFRNENVIDEIYVNKGDTNFTEKLNNNDFSPNNYTGKPAKVAKSKDYFTSALPSPQKGEAVKLPLGEFAPVVLNRANLDGQGNLLLSYTDQNGWLNENKHLVQGNGSLYIQSSLQGTSTSNRGLVVTPYTDRQMQNSLYQADLSEATGASINDLRYAIALQSVLERDSLYGSRYNEFLLSAFGVVSPDARLQMPEYLGGGRIPIQIQQVAQTSNASDDISALGSVAGYSLTNGYSKYSKGFVEHGRVYTLACIRQFHTYSQGLPKRFMRQRREDFYDPAFAHIGEQPIYKEELFVPTGDTAITLEKTPFGYNEAWADYRSAQSRVTGVMRPQATDTLDVWHLADNYDNAPSLVEDFINETPIYLDRALSVPSSSMPQFILDFFFKVEAIRVMPTYSIPAKLGV